MNIPTSRYSQSPLTALSVATLRRWYFSGERPLSEIERYAIICELERRDYPVDDWPAFDPFFKLSTEELRAHLQTLEDAGDQIAAHAVLDEINERGAEQRSKKENAGVGHAGRGAYSYSFAPC